MPFRLDDFNCEVFKMKITLSVCRRKSSNGMNDAENERTSNIYGDNEGNGQDLGNAVPLEDMPNEQVNMGSATEHPTSPYTQLGNAPARPVYSVVRRNRLGR